MKTKKYICECSDRENIEIQKIYDHTVQTVMNTAEEYGLTYEISTEIDERIKKDYYIHHNLFDMIFRRSGTQLSIAYTEKYLKNSINWDTDSIYGFFRYEKYVRKFRISTTPIRVGIGTDIIDRQVREHAKELLECVNLASMVDSGEER